MASPIVCNYFNNDALQAMIDEYGDRISCIIFDNKVPIFIGYPSSPIKHVSELELVNKGGTDLVGVPMYPKDPKAKREGVKFMLYHPTIFLQIVVVADEEHPDALVDPFMFG